jgi:AcrR family transcriptional regulator
VSVERRSPKKKAAPAKRPPTARQKATPRAKTKTKAPAKDTDGAPRASYHHGDLHRALKEATAVLLSSSGVENFSLRKAAQAAGVDPAAVYRHFADKDALLLEVAHDGFFALAARMEAGIDAATDDEGRFRATGEAYVRFALAEPALFRLMFGPLTANETRHLSRGPRGRGAHQILLDALAAVSPQAPPGQFPGAAVSAWALVHGLTILVLDGRVTYPLEPLIHDVLRRALDLVRAPTTTSR